MKIKSLIVASLIAFSVSNSFATYVRTTVNGGPNGYNKTSKTADGENTTISCQDPGYEACPLSPANPLHGGLVDAAVSRIQSGQLSGSLTNSNGTVTWTSDDTSMTNSTITIN
jgi:hypothetical protein